MLPKKIGFLTPYILQSRGNATTAKRLKEGLTNAGITVELFAYEEETWREDCRKRLEKCDLLHILHFDRFIKWKRQIRDFPRVPYIVTAGGTDLYSQSDRYTDHQSFLEEAQKVIVFSSEGKKRLEARFSLKAGHIAIIPQSVWFPECKPGKGPALEGSPRLLLPAGLRPVKDVLYLLKPLVALQKCLYPSLKWVMLGPVLDQAVYQEVRAIEKEHDWLVYQPPVPLSEIPKWYDWADVVLNTSLSEGQSSAVLEAMALKVPVLARKIPGNESVITDFETGLLFSNEDEFIEKLQLLLTRDDIRSHMIQKANEAVNAHHSLEKEMAAYLAIYESLDQKCQAVN